MLPPMMPTSALTAMVGIPHRAKILKYALWSVLYCWSRPPSSLSRLYASFMVNSRARIRPALGRGSSRNLVWIWYTSLTNFWSVVLYRPDLSHTSAGCTTGIESSCPPTASISSRKIFSILPIERFASGRYEKIPAASCLMNPALSSSPWLATSTLEVASRNVRAKSVLMRMANRLQATGYRLQDHRGVTPLHLPNPVCHYTLEHADSSLQRTNSARRLSTSP